MSIEVMQGSRRRVVVQARQQTERAADTVETADGEKRAIQYVPPPEVMTIAPVKNKGGRPKGSKNKPKAAD